jgi:hypothetical protein
MEGGKASARRGVTPFEAELLSRALGREASRTQALAFAVFGRIYGQGILETPVALQAASALAVIDTFEKRYPGKVKSACENIPGNIGRVLGSVLDIGEVLLVLAVIMHRRRIGANEDMEGNVLLGEKGRLMKALGLAEIPTIVVEGKAYVPGPSDPLQQNTFWIRYNSHSDNRITAESLAQAAKEIGFPHQVLDTAFPRGGNSLETGTRDLGKKIESLGRNLQEARTSREKVRLLGELSLLASQDAGGVTFMSDALQDVVGSAGMVPGTSAVVSLLVTPEYIRRWKIPELTEEDVGNVCTLLCKAACILAESGGS